MTVDLPNMRMLDKHGDAVLLADLYRSRRIVLCVTRHLGCRFCAAQLSEMSQIRELLRKHDVDICVLGMGTPQQARCVGARVTPAARVFAPRFARLASPRVASQ